MQAHPLQAHATAPQTDDDARLVALAIDGDRAALDALVRRHQPFIYNVAWRMVHDPDAAKDLTQEVLIKVITKLSRFEGKSAFRTWLYRIVVNEFLMMKRRPAEVQFGSFEEYGAQLDAVPNPELNAEEELVLAEASLEMKTRCMAGMLMCLDREQRLTYILGDVFDVDHKLGAELFGISPANFRVRLHRARKDLHSYMQNKCGLVNPDNPCRCPKKAKALVAMGHLDKDKKVFAADYRHTVRELVHDRHDDLAATIDRQIIDLRRGQPSRTDIAVDESLAEVLEFFE